jgi:hypothetical protein
MLEVLSLGKLRATTPVWELLGLLYASIGRFLLTLSCNDTSVADPV